MEKTVDEKPTSGEVQYRLMIPGDLHSEMKELSDKNGISMRQIILDGARFRCRDLKRMFKEKSVSDYRNQ